MMVMSQGAEVTVSPFTVKVAVSKTFRLPSRRAASTSATFSAVPAAQDGPNQVTATAPSS